MSEQQFQVGDLVAVTYLDARGNFIEVPGHITRFSQWGAIQIDSMSLYEWSDPRMVKLISRAQKTEKKKVWVWAFKEDPAGNKDFKNVFAVQIEAEVPCE